MKKIFANLRKELLFPWLIIFVGLQLAVTEFGGTNALSRFAMMRAFTESRTFAIDNYQDWTLDWSRSPNGQIYSNKAPGGALLGLPLFIFTDSIAAFAQPHKDEYQRRIAPTYWQMTIQSLLMQIIPFALLSFFISQWLLALGISKSALYFFAIALFFGNTASIFLNSYFGHGLAAVLFLASLLTWIQRKYGWSALWLGFAALTDYLALPLLPIMLLITFWRERQFQWLKNTCIGIIPPAFAWSAYHWLAFGAPWKMASQFINPDQIELLPNAAMGGIWQIIPPLENIYALLFGPARGLLYTQPWLIITFVLFPIFVLSGPIQRGRKLFLWLYCILSFSTLALIWVNAGFSGWHGGYSAGPRYISFILPAWAILAALLWDRSNYPVKFILALSLFVTIILRSFIYAQGILAPNEPLWPFYLAKIHTPTSLLRIAIFLIAIIGGAWWAKMRERDSLGKE